MTSKNITAAALTHAIASGNFGWNAEKETALVAEVARIASEKGRTGTSFRDTQFRANVARNIRRRDLRASQAAVIVALKK